MKKTVFVFALTLLLLLFCAILCGKISRHTVSELTELVSAAETSVRNQDYGMAGEICRQLLAVWEKREPLLQLWTVHEDTDNVGVLMEKMHTAVRMQSPLHACLLCDELVLAIDHLYHRDAPLIKNIF